MSKPQRPPLHFIRRLCAHLGEADIADAEERFWRYLDINGDLARDKLRERGDRNVHLSPHDGFDKVQ
jgi:hypothetical protein